jgi:hypothetical protein
VCINNRLAWAVTLILVVRALIQYGKGEPAEVEGIQPPGPNSTDSLSPDVEMNGGAQFKRKPLVPFVPIADNPPSLPELPELGTGQEDFYFGDPPLEMPEVDRFGGNPR